MTIDIYKKSDPNVRTRQIKTKAIIMNQKLIYLVLDENGDVHAAADTVEMAEFIIEKDTEYGLLKKGAIVQKRFLYGTVDKI